MLVALIKMARNYVQILIFGLVVSVDAGNEWFCNSVLDGNFASNDTCDLIEYNKREAIECLDRLSLQMASPKQRAHLYFLGDSRMLQQFQSFLKILPLEEDFVWTDRVSEVTSGIPQYDIDYFSTTYKFSVSYRWTPVFKQELFALLNLWSDFSDKAPYFVIIGFGVHHMWNQYFEDEQSFERNLVELLPTLKQLAKKTKVVWWNQYPIIDLHNGNMEVHPKFGKIHLEKQEKYNALSRRLLKDTDVVIWITGHDLAYEYLRGCKLNGRSDWTRYHNCLDFTHTGFVAIYKATQYLYNHLCNRFLVQSDNPSINISQNVCCD